MRGVRVENRALSFVLLALIYAAAGTLGVMCYIFLPLAWWVDLLLADVIATVFVYIFSAIFANASVYDPYWSVQPMCIIGGFGLFFISRPSVAGILVYVAIMVWGLRLTANWAYTFKGLTHEDWRYASFRGSANRFLFPVINFCGFHLMPTLIVYACTLPAVFTVMYAPDFNAGSIIFFVVSIAAAVLQGVADCTMHAFRKAGTGGFNRRGVWKYSRHPNYLGEIIMWWSIGLAAVCVMPDKWYLLAGALLNTLMFLFISIPLAEKRQSKKPGFDAYKKNTRMLLPIYKKQTDTSDTE